MRTNRMKVLVFVFIVAFALGSTITAFGASVGKNITVFFNDIKLMVDEKVITPKDANGNIVEPFIYNGTTYLPVRALAEALGQDVNWDSNTATVVIGKYDAGESLYPDVKLEKMDYLYENRAHIESNSSIKDNFGNSYTGYIYVEAGGTSNGNITYALNSKYSKLTGTVILKYDYRNRDNNEGELLFITDDKVVKKVSLLNAGDSPVDFQIDLNNVNRLEIQCTGKAGWANAIVDAGLYK